MYEKFYKIFHFEKFVYIILLSRLGTQPAWGGESSLSEVTSVQLEFRDLSRVTNNSTYEVNLLSPSLNFSSKSTVFFFFLNL